MTDRLAVQADLTFVVDVPGEPPVTGTVRGSGGNLVVEVSDTAPFSAKADTAGVGFVADQLARRGLRLTVRDGTRNLVTLGVDRNAWWHRLATRSRHVRIEGPRAAWALLRGRSGSSGGVLPTAGLMPASTLWPVAPTLARSRRHVTTTHDRPGGGRPRLILAPPEHARDDDVRREFRLATDVTTIGSADDNDIVLPGTEPHHAEVHRDQRDEYVLVRVDGAETIVNGQAVERAQLRTATRIRLAGWTMSFYREEYADHGRPYGGRVGGEAGHEVRQPPRRADAPDQEGRA